jgi:hypothetical protein
MLRATIRLPLRRMLLLQRPPLQLAATMAICLWLSLAAAA